MNGIKEPEVICLAGVHQICTVSSIYYSDFVHFSEIFFCVSMSIDKSANVA